ncbi:hypothetical protein [Rubinisphaera italica]|nr:hypothetical protein [Rubinisphaera italica]
MPTRTRRQWKPDHRGNYVRQIGWKLSKNGKIVQHKFNLGQNRSEAERRESRLREFWDCVESASKEDRPLWSAELLAIAQQIAEGQHQIRINKQPNELLHHYSHRLKRLASEYPFLQFVADDRAAYEIGKSVLEDWEAVPSNPGLPLDSFSQPNIEQLSRWVSIQQQLDDSGFQLVPNALLSPSDVPSHAMNSKQSARGHAIEPLRRFESAVPNYVSKDAPPSGATLHQAFKSYQHYLEQEYHRVEEDQISAWGRTQVRQVTTLMQHHVNRLLVTLDGEAIDELFAYWRRRPSRLGTNNPMTAKSCSNYLGTLTRFLKWLHKSRDFDWRKSEDFGELDTRVKKLPSDDAKKSLRQVETFSLDELKLLMRYGQPMDRLFLLLGLNCGFGRAEIASLLVGEVHLFQAHSPSECEIIGCQTTDNDSFIKRIRRKSGVYGEHLLFPMTVRGIEWAIQKRKQFPDFGPEARLLLTEKGKPFDQPTKSGNTNQLIPNAFAKLIKRIEQDGNEIRNLSFGKLRKTASHLIKLHSDGETMGVFDCHGQPVQSDDLTDSYSNRLFGRVFEASRRVETYLAPVFSEAGQQPFERQPQAYTKRSTIDRIIELHQQGYPTGQIASGLQVSKATASRHIQRHNQLIREAAENG